MPDRETKLQPERIMGEVCLGVAIAGVEILVIAGLVLTFG